MAKKSLYLILFLLYIYQVSALGISSQRIQSPILYQPGLEFSNTYTVFGYNGDVKISVNSDLEEYLSLSDIQDVSEGKQFALYLKFPEKKIEKAGLYKVVIRAEDMPPQGQGVGGVAVVEKWFEVLVLQPYE